MQTLGAGSSTQPECTLMTHDQYVDLKNEYCTMIEEMIRYNEHKASQQEPTALKQYPLNRTRNQSNPILKKLKHPLNHGNHNTPPQRGQVGPVSPRQQKAEGEKVRPTRPIML